MFKSSKKKGFSFYIKELMWPSMGWKRAAHYIALRVMRLSAASDSVPRGIACGISASFFPVFGVHAILAVGMAFAIRANAVAAALGTLVFPPILLPLVFSFDFLIGKKILGWLGYKVRGNEDQYLAESSKGFHQLMEHFWSYFMPAFIGFALCMAIVWPLAYFATHKAILLLRAHRQAKKQA